MIQIKQLDTTVGAVILEAEYENILKAIYCLKRNSNQPHLCICLHLQHESKVIVPGFGCILPFIIRSMSPVIPIVAVLIVGSFPRGAIVAVTS